MSVEKIPAIGDVIKWTFKKEEHISEVVGYGLMTQPKSNIEYYTYIVILLVDDEDDNGVKCGEPFYDDIHVQPHNVIEIYRKEPKT